LSHRELAYDFQVVEICDTLYGLHTVRRYVLGDRDVGGCAGMCVVMCPDSLTDIRK